jgi:hypothetical protein
MVGGLALLVILAVVIFGVSMARHRMPSTGHHPRSARPADAVAPMIDGDLAAALERSVTRSQLTREVADAILASEGELEAAGRAAAHGAGRPRRAATPTVEAIGYLGSVLALVGVGFLVGRSWSDIGQPGRIGMLGGLAAVLLAVGLLLRHEEEAVLWRLRNFVLLISTVSLAGCTAVNVVDTFDWRNEPVVISIGLVVSLFSAVLWARRDRPAQQVTTAVGSLVAVGAAMGWWLGVGATGVTVLVLSAVWIVLANRDLVPPRPSAELLGLAGLLVGPAITSSAFDRWAPLLGLGVALLLLAYGATSHQFTFTGFGVIGLLGYLTFAVAKWFGSSLKAPGVLVVSGIALLIATLVLVRRGRQQTGRHHIPRAAH